VKEITGGYHCNGSGTDHCIWKLLKKFEYNGSICKILVNFKEACVSFRREVMCYILIEFGIPMKLVMLIKMCMHEVSVKKPNPKSYARAS
jgi:hypothetical protein